MSYKQQAGFTLIELVVGMALMVLIMSGVAGILTTFIKNGVQGVDLIDRQQEARWAVSMMAQDIRYATKFYTAAGSGSSVDLERTDSKGASVRIRYNLAASGNAGNYILQRTLLTPTAVTSPLGNSNRGYVGAGDFTVTTAFSGTKVTQVQIVYKIRKSSTDTGGAIAQTTIYPINGIAITSP